MHSLKGLSINAGIYIGKARFLSSTAQLIPEKKIPAEQAEHELHQLLQAMDKAYEQLENILRAMPDSPAEREIFEAHQIILKDPDLLARLEQLVLENHFSSALAAKTAFEETAAAFMAMDNDFFAQRAADYKDLQQRILAIILGDEADPLAAFLPGEILFCSEPSPSLVTNMASKGIRAWVSQRGAYTSHAAILSRGLDIVALSAIADLPQFVSNGQLVIVDATDSLLIVEPDAGTLSRYREKSSQLHQLRQMQLKEALQPAITKAGRRVKVLANIELPQEAPFLKDAGAEGIGLFRTEFLYLDQSSLPSEEQQYQYYRQVASDLAPHPVTIRSFDLGGDKLSHLIPSEREDNPYLGCRGLRFSLFRQDIFKTQLRAILRAALHGDIRLMFPMVNDAADLLTARRIVNEYSQELDREGIEHRKDIPLGVMIEVPSAALCASELAQEADFFSIGTNDLAQYTLAVDRNSDALSSIYIQHHPAVLKLIAQTIQAAHEANIPVAVCGEMSSIPAYIPMLVGLQIDELSVPPKSIAQCKQIIRRCDEELNQAISSGGLKDLATIEWLIFNDFKKYYEIGSD